MFTLAPLFIGYSNVVLAGNTSGLTSSFTSLLTETSYSSNVPSETCLNPLPNNLGSTVVLTGDVCLIDSTTNPLLRDTLYWNPSLESDDIIEKSSESNSLIFAVYIVSPSKF